MPGITPSIARMAAISARELHLVTHWPLLIQAQLSHSQGFLSNIYNIICKQELKLLWKSKVKIIQSLWLPDGWGNDVLTRLGELLWGQVSESAVSDTPRQQYDDMLASLQHTYTSTKMAHLKSEICKQIKMSNPMLIYFAHLIVLNELNTIKWFQEIGTVG